MLKISIITPSYNQGRFIEDAIQSVLTQGYPHFEHIIIDNCSTDQTASIVHRYPHIRFISEPDKGQSDALNKGFKMATGDIIGWLNADDYYLPNTFIKVNQAFGDLSKDVIYSNVKFVNTQKSHLRNFVSHRPVKWLSLLFTYIQSTSLFFRKSIIDNNYLLDTNFRYKMDKDFYTRLLYGGYRFHYINDYFACFRWHDTNKTNENRGNNRANTLEGFTIFSRDSKLNLSPSKFNINIYRYAIHLLGRPMHGLLLLLEHGKILR